MAADVVAVSRAKFEAVLPHLDERARRLVPAGEARAMGHGGIAAVAAASGRRGGGSRPGWRSWSPGTRRRVGCGRGTLSG